MRKDQISARAADAYTAARENQYVRRLVEDQELRENLVAAAVSARKAYQRAQTSRVGTVQAVTSDRKVKRELEQASDALREAADRIRAPRRKRHTFRNLVALSLLSGGLVLVFSESARKAVLDAAFGAEEEFVYTSTTTTTEGAAQTNGTPVAE